MGRSASAITKSTVAYFLLVTKQDRAQCQADAPIPINNNNVGAQAENEEDGESNFPHPWKCARTRRCKPCLRSVQGDGYTIAARSMPNQAQQCQHCKDAVCRGHQVLICKDCSKKFTIKNVNENAAEYDSQ